MGTLHRRLRGILGMALTWAVLWAPFGAGASLWQWWMVYQQHGFRMQHKWRVAGIASLEFGVWGALAGAGFALALMLMARRSDDRRLVEPRLAALLGGAAALVLMVGYRLLASTGALPTGGAGITYALAEVPSMVGAIAVGLGALGATVAGTVVRLARRAPAPLPRETGPARLPVRR